MVILIYRPITKLYRLEVNVESSIGNKHPVNNAQENYQSPQDDTEMNSRPMW